MNSMGDRNMLGRNARKRIFVALTIVAPLIGSGGEFLSAARGDIVETVVSQVRQANPTTDEQILRAVDDLLNVGAIDVAREYLEKSLQTNSTGAERARVHRNMGTPFFLRLISTNELSPLAAQVADRYSVAAEQIARDPRQIARWVALAGGRDASGRREAWTELSRVGAPAVPPLLTKLSEATSPEQRSAFASAIQAIGFSATEPLMAAISSDDPALQVAAATALAETDAPTALPYLLRPSLDLSAPAEVRSAASRALTARAGGVPTLSRATAILRREIDRQLVTDPNLPGSADPLVTVWIWDPAQRAIVAREFISPVASLVRANRMARDLFRLAPTDRASRWRLAGSRLALAQLDVGMDQPLSETTIDQVLAEMRLSAADLNTVLVEGIERNHIPMTIAAANVLAHFSASLPEGSCCRESRATLAFALRHPNLMVRMAAASAITSESEFTPFAGASDLLDSLAFAAGSTGVRKALLLDPQSDDLDRMAGYLEPLGFQPILVRTPREAMRIVRRDPDIELILVSDRVGSPSWTEVVQHLAFDYHSAETPICVVATGDRFPRAEELTGQLDRVVAYPMPRSAEAMVNLLQATLPQTAAHRLTPDQRLQAANRALLMMAKLGATSSTGAVFEFGPYEPTMIGALSTPALSASASQLLGVVATPAAQGALVEFAARPNSRPKARQAAAEALRVAIIRSGILLSQDQILEQYDRYDRTRETDETSAAILSHLLDTFELSVDQP